MRAIGTMTLVTLAGLTACGGGPDLTDPPPDQAAASLAIATGDGQTGTPGSPVAVRPAVRVRDAQGDGVSGVVVNFVVEAGGGSVQRSSATTGSDGVASPGDWILGAGEGENRLRASTGSLTPVVFTAQGQLTAITLADTSIGAGGGTITYRKAGAALDGLTLTIPPGAFPGSSRWLITSRPTQGAPALRFGQAVGAVLEISSDQGGYADSLLVLEIPHARDPDAFAMAFAWDQPTGRLEALPLVGQNATTLTVVSRHFNPGLLAGRPASAAAAGSGPAAVVVAGLRVFIVTASNASLAVSFSSGFTPGVDDWEFPNYGSYAAPGGHCAGQSVSAIWYFLRQKQSNGGRLLYGQLAEPTLSSFWPGNPHGYRFASWTHAWGDQSKIFQGERQMAAIGQRSGVPVDRLYFYSLALAFAVTGDPHLVTVSEIDGLGNFLAGHALVAFASERTRIWVADPNFPGEQRGIVYLNDQLGPYTSRPNASATDTHYNRVSFLGISAIIPLADLDAAWSDVVAGTIGSDLFPSYRLEYLDTLTSTWRTLNNPLLSHDTLTTYLGDLAIRTICPGCAGQLPGGPAHQQPLWLVDHAGADIGYSEAVDGVTVPLPVGPRRFFAVVLGLPYSSGPEAQDSAYLDFRRVEVKSLSFSLAPVHTTGTAGATLTFVARPMGGAPPNARYLWDFGDGSPIVNRVSDSTASHQYTADGFYRVTVTLANGRHLARATGTVQVGTSLTIVPNPATTPVNTPLTLVARTQTAGVPVPSRYLWDFGDGGTFQQLGDSSASHTWTTAGTYTVTVVMQDPVSGAERGRGSGQVQVTAFGLVQVSAGYSHACGITAAGAAWCWGRNQFGQIGDGTTTSRLRPVLVSGGHVFSQIAVGQEHTCGLTPAGLLWCWGRHTWGQLGIGSADNLPHRLPVQVLGIPPLASFSAGMFHTCGRTAAGQAWCWGNNDFGVVGDGTFTHRSQPVPVTGGHSFAQLSAGFERTCGVTPFGAYCWGNNGGITGMGVDENGDPLGILGVGSVSSLVPQPAQVAGATPWAEVSAGYRYSCGRTTVGMLSCWGANRWGDSTIFAGRGGQLGDGSRVSRTQPVPTAVGAGTFVSVGAGFYGGCALSSLGEAWCWGTNGNGEVGNGGSTVLASSTDHPTPIKVVGGQVFTSLSVGWTMACGITAARETWCWGANFWGNLGDGTIVNRSTPVRVSP